MRIGIMLRSLSEKGGIGVFTEYITTELLSLDPTNQYFLYLQAPEHIEKFSCFPNAHTRLVPGRNKLVWDQLKIPFACLQDRLDVIFHPKFTVPLLAPCKAVMVLHGAGWFMTPYSSFWSRTQLAYVHLSMPLYLRKSAAVLSVSELTTQIFNQTFSLPSGKIQTVYFGPGKQFRRVDDPQKLQAVREKYGLPDRFVFTLSGYDRGRRKNISGILSAFASVYDQKDAALPPDHSWSEDLHLVVGGKDCIKFKTEFDIPDNGYGQRIHFPGWIDQQDLPAIYSLAEIYLYPSYTEAFPIPLTEAMACGTPIITSNLNGMLEIAGDAALFIDPQKPEEISRAMVTLLKDPGLRQKLSELGLERSKLYSWERCARQTLDVLAQVTGKKAGWRGPG